MNNVRCPVCKEKYRFDGLPPERCPACRVKDEEAYRRLRDLVKDHQGINIADASEQTGVPIPKILRYMRKGLLDGINDPKRRPRCAYCGVLIKEGRYCTPCNRKYVEPQVAEILKDI